MPTRKPAASPVPSSPAGGMRDRILEAAASLLRDGRLDFSMRDLAAKAGVSFATPFNQFGSKIAIMQALSSQRITRMAERFAQADMVGDAADRVLAAVDIATAVMLEDAQVSRAVIGSLGAPSNEPGQVRSQSRALWADAIKAADGFAPDLAELGRTALPDYLAMAFRGVLSFWTAGEINDSDFPPRARAATAALLLGFVPKEQRARLAGVLGRS